MSSLRMYAMPLTRQKAELQGRFSFYPPALFFARVRLKNDHLILTGWYWRGRYRRAIPRNRILHADATGEEMLLLWLTHGETIRLKIKQARIWQERLMAPPN